MAVFGQPSSPPFVVAGRAPTGAQSRFVARHAIGFCVRVPRGEGLARAAPAPASLRRRRSRRAPRVRRARRSDLQDADEARLRARVSDRDHEPLLKATTLPRESTHAAAHALSSPTHQPELGAPAGGALCPSPARMRGTRAQRRATERPEPRAAAPRSCTQRTMGAASMARTRRCPERARVHVAARDGPRFRGRRRSRRCRGRRARMAAASGSRSARCTWRSSDAFKKRHRRRPTARRDSLGLAFRPFKQRAVVEAVAGPRYRGHRAVGRS